MVAIETGPSSRSSMKTAVRLAVVVSLLASTAGVRADVVLPRIFGDHMVLQRDMAVPVWGRAMPGETVTVRFAGQERQARADSGGRWELVLAPLTASADSREMVISSGNIVQLKDILVGEVWLCSGQSNMEYAVGVAKKWAPPAAASDPELAQELRTTPLPTLRLFRVEKELKPPEVVSSGWHEAAGAARDEFSAVGYFFGRRLRRELDVPIGMIQAAWGGSRIEEWTPPEAYAKLAAIFTGDAMGSFERDSALVGRDYSAMVRPLAPFALRGVIWYQGESNLIAYNDGIRYAEKMRVFIDSWRAAWNRPEPAAGVGQAMPFYFVQIAPYLYTSRQDNVPHTADELPRLWEAQAAALQIPHTGMVPTTDLVDDVGVLHPAHKRRGGRPARRARASRNLRPSGAGLGGTGICAPGDSWRRSDRPFPQRRERTGRPRREAPDGFRDRWRGRGFCSGGGGCPRRHGCGFQPAGEESIRRPVRLDRDSPAQPGESRGVAGLSLSQRLTGLGR